MTRSISRSLTRRTLLGGAAALGTITLPGFGQSKALRHDRPEPFDEPVPERARCAAAANIDELKRGEIERADMRRVDIGQLLESARQIHPVSDPAALDRTQCCEWFIARQKNHAATRSEPLPDLLDRIGVMSPEADQRNAIIRRRRFRHGGERDASLGDPHGAQSSGRPDCVGDRGRLRARKTWPRHRREHVPKIPEARRRRIDRRAQLERQAGQGWRELVWRRVIANQRCSASIDQDAPRFLWRQIGIYRPAEKE